MLVLHIPPFVGRVRLFLVICNFCMHNETGGDSVALTHSLSIDAIPRSSTTNPLQDMFDNLLHPDSCTLTTVRELQKWLFGDYPGGLSRKERSPESAHRSTWLQKMEPRVAWVNVRPNLRSYPHTCEGCPEKCVEGVGRMIWL